MNQVADLLDQLVKNVQKEEVVLALCLMIRLFGSILSNPNIAMFRVIKKSIPKIK